LEIEMTRFLALFSLILLSGCSSFKLGAFCYIPAGNMGMCNASTAPQSSSETPDRKL
jgi:hypothetical protein